MIIGYITEATSPGAAVLTAGGDPSGYFIKFFHLRYAAARVYAAHGVRKVFECEDLCMRHDYGCGAVNVYYHKPGVYSCDLISDLPHNITQDMMEKNRHGKFIIKKGLPSVSKYK